MLGSHVVQKLRHYKLAYIVYVISKANLTKYISSRLVLDGQLVKCAVILEQYDIVYMRQNATKG